VFVRISADRGDRYRGRGTVPGMSGDTDHDGSERRGRPSEELVIEFLLDELRDAHERIADLEALAMRTTWRLVS